MSFNLDKCNVMTVTREQIKIIHKYMSKNCKEEIVQDIMSLECSTCEASVETDNRKPSAT